jgi:haloacetate dehalogenase
MSRQLFPESFSERRFRGSEVELHYLENARDGKPPLLLLHGFPQTHVMWHKVAEPLSRRFHVIAPDLRGYGDSGKPESAADHFPHSKRAMGRDLIELMQQLGYERFNVAGHARGARVTPRLCLDHLRSVLRACVMDIVPTRFVFEHTDSTLARAYYHWFFLQQPAPFPERLIAAEAELFLRHNLETWSRGNMAAFDQAAIEEYLRCISDAQTLHAMCEDYRAAATIDLEHDGQDVHSRIHCPLLVLWGARGFVGQNYDVLETWRGFAAGPVEGAALDCGHFLPEEKPAQTLQRLESFFAA